MSQTKPGTLWLEDKNIVSCANQANIFLNTVWMKTAIHAWLLTFRLTVIYVIILKAWGNMPTTNIILV